MPSSPSPDELPAGPYALTFAEQSTGLVSSVEYGAVQAIVDRLRSDRRFADELAVCDRAGIPHSHFLGDPLKWTAEDRDKAVAFLRFEAMRCPGCGTFSDEWFNSDGTLADDPAFVAVAEQCLSCSEKEGLAAHIADRRDGRRGVSIRLRRFDPVLDDDVDDMPHASGEAS